MLIFYQNPEWRSKTKKDPGIPNLFPYKDRVLHEIEEKRRLKQEELERRRQESKTTQTSSLLDEDGSKLPDPDEGSGASIVDFEAMSEKDGMQESSNPMAALLTSAKARAAEYEMNDDTLSISDTDTTGKNILSASRPKTSASTSVNAFTRLFPSVLSQADVLLYVLDARDPLATRSVSTERQIAAAASGTKRLILILNKIDLVPPHILKPWLTYLRRYHPTVPLRASNPAANAQIYDHKSLTRSATADALLKALKSYAATQNLKRALTVGVVGYPNVGKSSVINALVSRLGRSSAPAPVGAEAGVTTVLQNIKLDKRLTLLDSPGVIFPSTEEPPRPVTAQSNSATTIAMQTLRMHPQTPLVLLNAVPQKSITDPTPAIALLLTRLQQTPSAYEHMLNYYGLPPLAPSAEQAGDVTQDFLVQVARKRGKLGKGGVPNLDSAARGVLVDWWAGRIGGWVEAPQGPGYTDRTVEDADTNMTDVLENVNGSASMASRSRTMREETAIVSDWAKPFIIEGLFGDGEMDAGG